ncbi:Ribosomal large subunit pseudouridine synthase D [Apilactobacillus kunkeei]|nr:Ribosomal large subunit pseudouridine synthase D [Apilactobacillus kunkeei]CAI2558213.1 Ribosomal large subunit pseudouridine synthase D [Apilactobacillus kunkeei]CAI2558253.1 Ribosomal large subunit pseudouridine synthase D [Apilactobacillus kunkeei]CAI2558397.1 Ribosomal large subunit pseudouridine synthase D [Apilactobacillus kunkeei]CAI2558445.1 Ribosomal large subunit pseudouridine synthase D [Apilactobacillus kunkeei]
MQKWEYTLNISGINAETSLREYLQKKLLIPKHLIFTLRTNERVLVNNKYLPMNFPIKNGDELHLSFIESDFSLPVQNLIPDNSIKMEILYEDDDLLVVNKPRGFKTHPNQPGETNTLLNFCEAYLNDSNQHAFMIHRLDQFTSGAIIVGKNPAVVPILVRLIKDKIIRRNYLAWTDGIINPPSGTIEKAIGFDPNDKRKRKIDGIKPLNAKTDYLVKSTTNNHSLVELSLHTGRTHQLRVHLASVGHPIMGDPLYNPNSDNDEMLLHSWELTLIRPYYMDQIEIKSPLPDSFKKFM